MSNTDFDFNDDLDDVLPWEGDEDEVIEGEEMEEVILDFCDPEEDLPEGFIPRRVNEALENYTLDELLIENQMDEREVVEILYELGYLGLPEVISEDGQVQDYEETEEI